MLGKLRLCSHKVSGPLDDDHKPGWLALITTATVITPAHTVYGVQFLDIIQINMG